MLGHRKIVGCLVLDAVETRLECGIRYVGHAVKTIFACLFCITTGVILEFFF